MTENKPTRRELLRPLHLLMIALACGAFAAGVTFVSTGAFTARVNTAIANGSYSGLTPLALGLVVGGGAFIVTLLLFSMMILAVDPTEFVKPRHRPVLFDEEDPAADTAATTATEDAAAEAEPSPESGIPSPREDPEG